MQLAQGVDYSYSTSGNISPVFIIIWVAVAIFYVAAYWRMFTKAGQPGWAAIIPIYNLYVMLKVIGRPAWWIILMLIPCVNIVILIITYLDLAKSFGKGSGFGVGLILLPIIFLPILAFGDATYVGPAAAPPAAPAV